MNETSIRLVDGETRTALPLSSPGRALSAANLAEAIDEIKLWATEQGLRGATARDLFEGYCRRLEAHGFELMRAYVSTQTLHPQWTGYGYTWKREWQSVREQQFARGGPVSQGSELGVARVRSPARPPGSPASVLPSEWLQIG
jgi:hypothetical protein